MQRLGPNDRKTFFVTAPVVGRLSCQQVVAILKKEIIIGSTMADEHSRTYSEDDEDCDDAERMESETQSSILGQKMAHPMVQQCTRKEVAMANYQ